ncbi:MAG: glycosyltransferase family 2 protein [Euryarchaeota archaeon]|nr:glycosyltransferase family 2 protein [Euryarchaeota archaeon]
MKISVVINTLNEEKNIKNCLECVKWADEIIIVDMYSDDKTVEIAKRYTDKIFFFERFGYADPARQFALEQASNEWLLIVDADELVTVKLRDRLLQIVEKDQGDVVYVPHNNYFLGSLVQYGGWGAQEDKHPRFFKKNFCKYVGTIHKNFIIKDDARIFEIEDPEEGFIHFAYIDFEHYIEKALNKYTTIEAVNMYEGKRERIDIGNNFIMFLLKMMGGLFNIYITNKGYKDGFRGLAISFLSVVYRVIAYMKLRLIEEFNSENPRKKILQEYQNLADEIIMQYNK